MLDIIKIVLKRLVYICIYGYIIMCEWYENFNYWYVCIQRLKDLEKSLFVHYQSLLFDIFTSYRASFEDWNDYDVQKRLELIRFFYFDERSIIETQTNGIIVWLSMIDLLPK